MTAKNAALSVESGDRMEPTPVVELADVALRFSSGPLVLDGVSLRVRHGEFLAVIGPSGCGKTTILGLISGSLTPATGAVVLSPDASNNLAYVFQRDFLLPWRNCLNNVALPLIMRGMRTKAAHSVARDWLARVGLGGYEDYYPSKLSGGMLKRVNLARSLAYGPKLLLMDEPFSALDAQTRVAMQQLLLELWEETGATVIFITHDLEEAILLGDRVAVITAGPSARVKEISDITIGRPRVLERDRLSKTFTETYSNLWQSLGDEVHKARFNDDPSR